MLESNISVGWIRVSYWIGFTIVVRLHSNRVSCNRQTNPWFWFFFLLHCLVLCFLSILLLHCVSLVYQFGARSKFHPLNPCQGHYCQAFPIAGAAIFQRLDRKQYHGEKCPQLLQLYSTFNFPDINIHWFILSKHIPAQRVRLCCIYKTLLGEGFSASLASSFNMVCPPMHSALFIYQIPAGWLWQWVRRFILPTWWLTG